MNGKKARSKLCKFTCEMLDKFDKKFITKGIGRK